MNVGRTSSTDSRAFSFHRGDFAVKSKCLVERDAMQSNGHVPKFRKDLHHQHSDTLWRMSSHVSVASKCKFGSCFISLATDMLRLSRTACYLAQWSNKWLALERWQLLISSLLLKIKTWKGARERSEVKERTTKEGKQERKKKIKTEMKGESKSRLLD